MAVTFDTNGFHRDTGSPTSSTASITVGSNSNRVLFACVYGDHGMAVSSVKWNTSETMTLVDSVDIAGIGAIFLYKLVAPSTGAHSGVANVSSTTEAGISLLSYYEVDQTTPVNTFHHTNGNSTDVTDSVTTTVANCWLAGFAISQRNLSASTGIATLRDTIFSQCIDSDSNASVGAAGAHAGHMTNSLSNVWELILWAIEPVQPVLSKSGFLQFMVD